MDRVYSGSTYGNTVGLDSKGLGFWLGAGNNTDPPKRDLQTMVLRARFRIVFHVVIEWCIMPSDAEAWKGCSGHWVSSSGWDGCVWKYV